MTNQTINQDLPFKPGETITYAIKKLGIKAGEATFVIIPDDVITVPESIF